MTGPASAGTLVGQPTPVLTTSPAATSGNVHPHEIAYATATKHASGEGLLAVVIE